MRTEGKNKKDLGGNIAGAVGKTAPVFFFDRGVLRTDTDSFQKTPDLRAAFPPWLHLAVLQYLRY